MNTEAILCPTSCTKNVMLVQVAREMIPPTTITFKEAPKILSYNYKFDSDKLHLTLYKTNITKIDITPLTKLK